MNQPLSASNTDQENHSFSTNTSTHSSGQPGTDSVDKQVINVIEEKIVIDKQKVETGKIRIKKTVTEELHSVSVPIVNDEYEIVRIPVPKKTLLAPPDPVRQEGDTTIISVIKEITIVEKRYEVIEEIHVTRHKTELPVMHEISLRTEHVKVDRETLD